VISGIGGSFRVGGDGSFASRSLLARLEDNDDDDDGEGANQARFLGINLVSDSSASGSDTNGMTGVLLSGCSSGGCVVDTAAVTAVD
jgi:hypothetical protein